MKKVELHLHLDGSIDEEYASKLIGRDVSKELIANDSKTLAEYLERFTLPIKLLQDIKNIEHFCYLLGKKLEMDEVIYAEVRFCPLFHLEKFSIEDVVGAIIKGFDLVSSVKVNLIFCMMRHFSDDVNKKIIALTEKFLNKGVVAIDLAGDEANFKTAKFKELFDEIKEKNIPFTIHAGEADNFTSVDAAISFGAKRIGHGIRSIESDETIKKLIEKKIILEVCPTSNVDTHVVDNIYDHPIQKLVDRGVLITINTDNRTVSNTSLNKEYDLISKTFYFDKIDYLNFNLNAIEAAFIDEDEKLQLQKAILKDYFG